MKKYLLLLTIIIYFFNSYSQEKNIAVNQKYAASIMDSVAYPAHNPRYAFDGDTLTAWHPQAYPSQWIAVHFNKEYDITRVKFWYGNDPASNTTQEIYTTVDSINWTLFETINPYHNLGTGSYEHVLSDTIKDSKGIKIRTTQNSSWVQWREIEVFTPCYDTCFVLVYDTIKVYDTIVTEVFDTTYVTVYDSISVTDTLIIDVTLTDVSAPNNFNTIKVYPNPVKDIVFINTGDNYSNMSDYTIKIISVSGTTVFESLVTQQLFEVDVSDFGSTGMYFIQIIDDTNQIIDIRKILLE